MICQGSDGSQRQRSLTSYANRVYMLMRFEWDITKSERNLRGHGFGFERAAAIFAGPVQTAIDERRDERRDYGEQRIIAFGEVEGDVLTVVYTDRDNVRRIISARYSNSKERELWQSFAKR